METHEMVTTLKGLLSLIHDDQRIVLIEEETGLKICGENGLIQTIIESVEALPVETVVKVAARDDEVWIWVKGEPFEG